MHKEMSYNPDCRLSEAVELLSQLVRTESLSRNEENAAALIRSFLKARDIPYTEIANNTLCVAPGYDPARPSLMLNSHIDTVRPAAGYSFDPFAGDVVDGRLRGLGSNDAGASAVTLLMTFLALREESLPFNLLIALTAEEEVGGEKGMRLLMPALAEIGIKVDMAIVGEPTGLRGAIAERGLLVLDCVTHGVSGHAAREEGVNAIDLAIRDIARLKNTGFGKVSDLLGPIKISVTMIEAGMQHNVIPDTCRWVVDVRTTDAYGNVETAARLTASVSENTDVMPRSTRVHASALDAGHPLRRSLARLGLESFVSPTTSDMSLLHGIPSLKLGPGESSRSHAADEYVLLDEIQQALELYPCIIKDLAAQLKI